MQFDSLKKIRKARVPTLFLSGLADQLIPPRMMTSLYKVCLEFLGDVNVKISCHISSAKSILWTSGQGMEIVN